jgi:hypothetical protein
MQMSQDTWDQLPPFALFDEVGFPGRRAVEVLSRSIGRVLHAIEYELLKLPDDVYPEAVQDDAQEWDALGCDYGLDSVHCIFEQGGREGVSFTWNWEVLNYELCVSAFTDGRDHSNYRVFDANGRPSWRDVVGQQVVDVATGWIDEAAIQHTQADGTSIASSFRGATHALGCVAIRVDTGLTVFITNSHVETGKLGGEYDELAVASGAQTRRLGLIGSDGRLEGFTWFRLKPY